MRHSASWSLIGVDRKNGGHSIQRLVVVTLAFGVSDFLSWFEDAYFLFRVRIFDASLSRANTNPKKIYCIDHSLVTSVSSGIIVNSGHLLENLVFIGLRRISNDIFYFKVTVQSLKFQAPRKPLRGRFADANRG